ncbi:MAG: lysylphosphatidylglycerol synthase transmembrane domain-containing protein [Trueperaceae bacterium]|nr:lysylphosphatidylglycerol synthase transmembrane domain-containing protein [Trueperaceae bacterium]
MTGTVIRALVASFLIGGAALAGVVAWLGVEELQHLSRIELPWLAAALGFLLASFLFAGMRLAMLVRRTGAPLRLRHAVRCHVLGLFASTVTPGGSGGMPALALSLTRQGVPSGTAWSSGVAAIAADTVFYGWSLPVALLVLDRSVTLPNPVVLRTAGLIVSVGGLAVAYLLAFRLAWALPLSRWALRGRLARHREGVERFLTNLLEAHGLLHGAPWSWHARFHLLVAASWGAFFAVLWASARGFGLPVDPWTVIAALVLVAGLGSVVPTPGGSGFFEFGASLALVAQGARGGVVGAVVVWRLISHYALFLIGPPLGGYLWARHGGPPAGPDEPAEVDGPDEPDEAPPPT